MDSQTAFSQIQNGITDQLSGAMIGYITTPVGVKDRDTLLDQSFLGGSYVLIDTRMPYGEDRGMLK
jgi:hypothetical protein